jgi:hypothetical protein
MIPEFYDEHTFKTPVDMEIFIAEQNRNRFSAWTAPLEEWQTLLILAASASFLGSVVRYIRDSLDKKEENGCRLLSVVTPIEEVAP